MRTFVNYVVVGMGLAVGWWLGNLIIARLF